MTVLSPPHPPGATDAITLDETISILPFSERHLVLVDDLRARSYRLWASLSSIGTQTAVATVEDADEAVAVIARRPHDVAVIAVALGDTEGLRLCRRLTGRPEPVSVFLYHDTIDRLLAGAALIAGATGVFASRVSAERLAAVLSHVIAGDPNLFVPGPGAFSTLAEHIDQRDRPIVAMLLERAHPDDIASLLGISAHAVRLRHQAILDQLDRALTVRLDASRTPEPSSSARQTPASDTQLAVARSTLPESLASVSAHPRRPGRPAAVLHA